MVRNLYCLSAFSYKLKPLKNDALHSTNIQQPARSSHSRFSHQDFEEYPSFQPLYEHRNSSLEMINLANSTVFGGIFIHYFLEAQLPRSLHKSLQDSIKQSICNGTPYQGKVDYKLFTLRNDNINISCINTQPQPNISIKYIVRKNYAARSGYLRLRPCCCFIFIVNKAVVSLPMLCSFSIHIHFSPGLHRWFFLEVNLYL